MNKLINLRTIFIVFSMNMSQGFHFGAKKIMYFLQDDKPVLLFLITLKGTVTLTINFDKKKSLLWWGQKYLLGCYVLFRPPNPPPLKLGTVFSGVMIT